MVKREGGGSYYQDCVKYFVYFLYKQLVDCCYFYFFVDEGSNLVCLIKVILLVSRFIS